MDDEINDDEMEAILSKDEQDADDEEGEEVKKNVELTTKLSFAERAETMTTGQLIELTCSLIDKPITPKKSPKSKVLGTDTEGICGSKAIRYVKKT